MNIHERNSTLTYININNKGRKERREKGKKGREERRERGKLYGNSNC